MNPKIIKTKKEYNKIKCQEEFKNITALYVSVYMSYNVFNEFNIPNDKILFINNKNIVLSVFPPNLEILIYDIDKPMPKFPSKLKYLSFSQSIYGNIILPSLPPNLETLFIICHYNHILYLPESLKILSINYIATMPDIPKNLEYLNIKHSDGHLNSRAIELPLYGNLKVLILHEYDSPLPPLPKTIKYIKLHRYTHQMPDLLSTSIRVIIFGPYYMHPLPPFPPTIRKIKLLCPDYPLHTCNNIPPCLKTLSIYNIKLQRQMIFNLQKLIININNIHNSLQLTHYNNQIFIFGPPEYLINTDEYIKKFEYIWRNKLSIKIKRNLRPYLLYIIYNKSFIPYEIYYHIYTHFNFRISLYKN